MAVLDIKIVPQYIYDISTSTLAYSLIWTTPDSTVAVPFTRDYFEIGSTNPSASPLPTFPDIATAIDYFGHSGPSPHDVAFMAIQNTATGTTYYTSATFTQIDSEVFAALSSVQSMIPTLVSQLANDTGFITASALSSYATTTALAAAASKAYEGTTLRSSAFPVIKSTTVSSGAAVFYLTNDGTSTGTTLFPNGVIADSVNLTVNDATAAYQMSWAFSNSNKTLTVTTNKLGTASLLTGILGQTAANGATVKLTVWGY